MSSKPDSLQGLVDRLAMRLIAAESGVSGERLESLTASSLPALPALLEGEQAFRRGEHERAVQPFASRAAEARRRLAILVGSRSRPRS